MVRETTAAVPAGINIFVQNRAEPPAAFTRERANGQLAKIGRGIPLRRKSLITRPGSLSEVEPETQQRGLRRTRAVAGNPASTITSREWGSHRLWLRGTTKVLAHCVSVYQISFERNGLHETLYQALMRCHQAMGAPSESLRVYERCRTLLRAALGVEPSFETTALYRSIRA
jgi:hypothetical protein